MPAIQTTAQYLSVVHKSPRIGWDTSVTQLPDIHVWFNTLLNESYVNTNTELNKYVVLTHLETDTNLAVEFVDWDSNTQILKFRPTTNLIPGAIYQVTIIKTLQSSTGRKMVANDVWTFQVGASFLSQVLLRSPGDATAHTGAPTLSWDGASGSATTGSVYYDVQVHTDWQFNDPLTWTSTTTASGSGGTFSTSIGVSIPAYAGYFWRVRARTDTLSGEWSSARSFWIGDTIQASPDTTQDYQPALLFHLTSVEPEDQETNLLSWPVIRAYFSTPLLSGTVTSGNIYLTRRPADGRASSGETTVTTTIDTSGNRIILTPTEDILYNTRYTLYITTSIGSTGGMYLPEAAEYYFTSRYKPIYGGTLSVKMLLGGFIEDVSDDEINFHLWRGSLYVNELLYTRVHRVNSRATINDLISYQPAFETWGMVRVAETLAAVTLLESHYYDLARDAGHRYGLATFNYEVSVELLTEIRAKIKELRTQLNELLATFLAGSTVPKTLIPGRLWHPCLPQAQDWSTRDWQRSNFIRYGGYDPTDRGTW